jgi:hypothetical protein
MAPIGGWGMLEGLLACCSHTAYRTAREAIDDSRIRSSARTPTRALNDHPASVLDDLIRASAVRGEVVRHAGRAAGSRLSRG